MEHASLLRSDAQVAGRTLPYDSLAGVRGRLQDVAPSLTRYNAIEPANFTALFPKIASTSAGSHLLTFFFEQCLEF